MLPQRQRDRLRGKVDVLRVDDVGVRHGSRALQHVFQLAEVARPVVVDELAECLAGEGFFRDVVPLAYILHQLVRQQVDVLPAVPQGRHLHGEGGEAVVEILPEASALHLVPQLGAGDGQQSHVHVHRAGGADGLYLVALDGIEQLRLHVQGQAAHLVQQQRAAVRLAEQSGGAVLTAEQGDLQQSRVHRRAVGADKGASPLLRLLDALRHAGAPRARLAGDEDVAVHLAELVGAAARRTEGGGGAVAQQGVALAGEGALGGLPVFALRRSDGGVALHDGGADVLDIAEFDDDARDLRAVADGQDGRQQREAVDLIRHVGKAGGAPVQHLAEVLLEQLALEEIAEVVAHHADLLLRAFGDEAAAPEKAADALLPGGVALLLPEFHLLGAVIQHHHLTDADEVVDGVRLFPHLHHDLLVADMDGDGDALKRHVQMEPRRLAAPQVFVHRLDAGPLIDAHRRQNVVGAETRVVDVQHRQIGGGRPRPWRRSPKSRCHPAPAVRRGGNTGCG